MGRSRRAQTTIDFAIAMGVFLIALTTVIAFMPNMIQPFTGGQQNPLVADRLAAQLTDDTLGSPENPSALNDTCTYDFFKDSGTTPCREFSVGDDVTTKLGVESSVFLNVSIQQNVSGEASPETVCAEETAGDVSLVGDCSSGILLADGPSAPNNVGSVTIARRYATLDDEGVYVVVKVWT